MKLQIPETCVETGHINSIVLHFLESEHICFQHKFGVLLTCCERKKLQFAVGLGQSTHVTLFSISILCQNPYLELIVIYLETRSPVNQDHCCEVKLCPTVALFHPAVKQLRQEKKKTSLLSCCLSACRCTWHVSPFGFCI